MDKATPNAEEQYRLLVEGAKEYAMILLDIEGRVTSWNAGAERILGWTESEALGQPTDLIFTPEERAAGVPEQEMKTAETEGKAQDVRWQMRKDGSRFWADGVLQCLADDNGTRRGFAKILRDATERKRYEERDRARLEDIFMRAPAFMATLQGPEHVFELANPPYFQLVGHRDILGKSVASAIPEVVEQGFIEVLDRVYGTGEAYVGNDVRLMLQVVPEGPLEERYVDFAYQPLYDEEGTISGILAHGIDQTKRKRLELEQDRLLEEARARAEREALLNRVGQALRGSPAPEQILETAVQELGQALGADYCFYMVYDQNGDTVTVGPEWHREGLTGIARQLAVSPFAIGPDPRSTAAQTEVISDTASSDPVGEHGLGALVRVPLISGTAITALSVAMADGARAWSADEVSLIEAVATQTQTLLEAVRVRLRERRIAQELQDALLPAIPHHVPGLHLDYYYRAALQEAGIGGDFAQVFSSGAEVPYLVVGDLAGKGLGAASQIATVTNMLRFALHNGQTLSGPIQALNDTLAQSGDLLSGFATLFVGRYDAQARTLNYVNCGQDPGIVLRQATGRAEFLPPTGPVLGAFSGAVYSDNEVNLELGDALALYTDGLSEAGPTRADLLTADGVANLLQGLTGITNPHTIVSQLIANIDAYAGGDPLDDQCLLVGVVSG